MKARFRNAAIRCRSLNPPRVLGALLHRLARHLVTAALAIAGVGESLDTCSAEAVDPRVRSPNVVLILTDDK
jgi:hypothetical protein